MSLINALNIGKSALAAHQAALAVTSNNIANAGNPDYTRQVARLEAAPDRRLKTGAMLGSGVNLASIERQIDDALEGRLRGAVSDSESAAARQQWLGRVEAVFNELGDQDLSTGLSAFFNSWSELANRPQDLALRQVVLQNGVSLAGTFKTTRSQLAGLRTDLESRMHAYGKEADSLLTQVAELNRQISTSEAGGLRMANNLRDQRDGVLKQLSEVIDVKTQDMGDGTVNVLLGSEPLVLGTTSRGVQLELKTEGATLTPVLYTRDDHSNLTVQSGQLGGLFALRAEINSTADKVDSLAAGLIFEVNKLHASGQGLEGITSATGATQVSDASAALNTPAAGLDFTPANGSFVVHVRQKGTGLVSSTLVQVDLDGSGSDSTLTSVAAALDAISGVSASVVAGRLTLRSESDGVDLSFSQDSSGLLASLGVSTFFQGATASDIAVNDALRTNPALLAAAKNGQLADNQTARAIASLESQSLRTLGGMSLKDSYESLITGIASSAQNARTNAEAAAVVQETLLTQREALSGVSLDEEAINLMRQQRAFQGAARVIAVVDEMMKTLLSI